MSRTIAERRFTAADQEAFAALTGDRNPMHMDAAAARRTQAGVPAVHGMHAALWALESLAATGVDLDALATLRVDFQRFLPVDGEVALVADVVPGAERVRAEIRSAGARAVTFDLKMGERGGKSAASEDETAAMLPPERPEDLAFEAMEGRAGRIRAPADAAARAGSAFPALAAALGAERVVGLALTSTVVGMVVPGLHSIYSGINIKLGAERGESALAYRVARADERYRLLSIEVAGTGFKAGIKAFARFPPIPAPTLERIAGLVERDEFAGRRALVVGGSRGIGAAAAKLLAAGGAEVTLTWRSGRAEAEGIAAELEAAFGPGRVSARAYDTSAPPEAQIDGSFTHVYYFATGRIFLQGGGVYEAARFEPFFAAYVAGFAALVEHLVRVSPDRPVSVLYPSSVAVEDRPAQMTEYAMAKAAGEILAQDLARGHRNLSISIPRLPRILTDQTATVPPVPAADPVEVMLPLLRAEGNAA